MNKDNLKGRISLQITKSKTNIGEIQL